MKAFSQLERLCNSSELSRDSWTRYILQIRPLRWNKLWLGSGTYKGNGSKSHYIHYIRHLQPIYTYWRIPTNSEMLGSNKAMRFSTFALLFACGVAAEQGSWCFEPPSEQSPGQATETCCKQVQGKYTDNRRCKDLRGTANEQKCPAFYRCCINQFQTKNREGQTCSWELSKYLKFHCISGTIGKRSILFPKSLIGSGPKPVGKRRLSCFFKCKNLCYLPLFSSQ